MTGIKSGLKAAGHEFVFGIYDGWTGLVRLPYRGFKEGARLGNKPSSPPSGPAAASNNGTITTVTKPAPAGRMVGLVKGVGMGVTGFVLKDISAIIGPIGYTMKGVVKQAQRGQGPAKYIRKARIVQGARELDVVSPEERRRRMGEVVEGWKVMKELWEALQEVERGDKAKRKKKQQGLTNGNGKAGAGANGKVADGVAADGTNGAVVKEKDRRDTRNPLDRKRERKMWLKGRGLARRRRVAVRGEAFESVEMARKALEELKASSAA